MIKALAIVILKPKKYFEMGARSTNVMMSLSAFAFFGILQIHDLRMQYNYDQNRTHTVSSASALRIARTHF